MKLGQLSALCRDQWMQEHRGDLIGLSLGGDSLAELSAETIGSGPLEISGPDGSRVAALPAGGVGVLVTEAVNPVTRSVIRISLAPEGDTATVDFGPHVPHGTVEIPPAPPEPPSDLKRRFTYHPPKPGQAETYEYLRQAAFLLAGDIDRLCPGSREKSLAITHLEEAVMWANASIARHS